jgi:hypothetical protein
LAKKLKKTKRDVEKLLRGGRYWDWLKTIEANRLEGEYRQDRETVWKTLIKRALRSPEGFAEFHDQATTFKVPPPGPDFQFLMALGRFLDDPGSTAELAALKGLGPAAGVLRERALEWGGPPVSASKLEKQLRLFVTQPEKVTQRHYQQLAKDLDSSPLASLVRGLGELLPEFRLFNHAGRVKAGWGGIEPPWITQLDRRLATLVGKAPGPLARILLQPFSWQVIQLLQRFPPQSDATRTAALLRCFPFILPLIAGDNAEAISKLLLLTHASGEIPLAEARKRISTNSFEDNLVLLGQVRKRVRQGDRDEDFLDFLFTPSNREQEDAEELLARLYDLLFQELEQRAGGLPPRDKRGLRELMDRLLAQDLGFLVDDPDDPRLLEPLLSRVLRIGCGGKRLALLALVVAGNIRQRPLRAKAEAVLDESGPLVNEDITWLTENFDDLYFPRLRGLVPVVERLRPDSALLLPIFYALMNHMETELTMASLPRHGSGLFGMFDGFAGEDWRDEVAVLREELAHLHDYPEMRPLRMFLDCFPENRYTREGLLRWLDELRQVGTYLGYVEDRLQALIAHRRELAEAFGLPHAGVRKWVDEQVSVIFGFLKDHCEDFRDVEPERIARLLDLVAAHGEVTALAGKFLVRLQNVLEERRRAGDPQAAALANQTLTMLQRLAATDKTTRRSPKTKRRTRK